MTRILRAKVGAAFFAVALAFALSPAAPAHATSPDDTLRHHVVVRLMRHAGVEHLSRIEVHVVNGVVTMRGEWPNAALKRDLGGVVASVPGVRVIDDHTTVSASAAPAPQKNPCPPGTIAYREGSASGTTSTRCVAAPACGAPQTRDASGQCVCPSGPIAYREGSASGATSTRCIAAPACGAPQTRDASGQCVCPAGTIAYREGNASGATSTRCLPAPVK
jgi:hypothetical protein